MNKKNHFSQAVKDLLEGKNEEPIIGNAQPEKAAIEKKAEPHPTVPPVVPQEPAVPAKRPVSAAPLSAGPTIIAQGTTIIGDIKASGDVEMLGSLRGNLEGSGVLKLCGKIAGNIKGKQIELCNSALQGNITATADVIIDSGSVVVGNITANSVVLGGRVKGNLIANTTVAFSENALLIGNVQASQLSVSNGAKLEGEIKIRREKEDERAFDQDLII